nr:hypothetical protein [Achromobacter ruhlandii]
MFLLGMRNRRRRLSPYIWSEIKVYVHTIVVRGMYVPWLAVELPRVGKKAPLKGVVNFRRGFESVAEAEKYVKDVAVVRVRPDEELDWEVNAALAKSQRQ